MKFLNFFFIVFLSQSVFAARWTARNLAIETDATDTKISAIQLTGLFASNVLSFAGNNPAGLETKIYRCSTEELNDICLYGVVTNNTGAAISAQQGFYFPDLRGLKPLTTPSDETILRMSNAAINPFQGAAFRQEYAGGLYQPYALRWIDYGTFGFGLSVFHEAWGKEDSPGHARPSLVVERIATDNGSLRIAWKNNRPLAAGEAWISDRFWFRGHAGGWAKGIESFRSYVKSQRALPEWQRSVEVPKHVREGIGFRTAWMVEGQETECSPKRYFGFNQVSELAKESAQHGLKEMVLFGAVRYSLPPLVLERKAGTKAEFLKQLNDIKSLPENQRANVSLFFNVNNTLNPIFPERHDVDYPASLCPLQAPTEVVGFNRFDKEKGFWTYDSHMVPGQEYHFKPAGIHPVQHQSFTVNYSESMLTRLKDSMTTWAQAGVSSWAMDEADDAGNNDFYKKMKEIRSAVAQSNPQATFAGEPFYGNLERAVSVLDYTWSWLDYTDAGPFQNVIKFPRLSVNVNKSPRIVKMAFAEGLYLNVMPSKPKHPNGSSWIKESADLSRALITTSKLRADSKFLPYFTDGVAIGDSILTKASERFVRANKNNHIGGATLKMPPLEYPLSFIRAHYLESQKKVLIVILNNASSSRAINFFPDVNGWVAPTIRTLSYTEGGTSDPSACVISKSGTVWQGRTKVLAPLEMVLCEISPL